MRRKLFFSKIPIVFLFITLGCQEEEIFEYKEVDAVIFEGTTLPLPPEPKTEMISNEEVLVNDNGISFICSKKTYSYANNMEEVIAFNPNAGTLYPGALVQGKDVREGILNSIGNFPRSPLTISLSQYGQAKTIESPTIASVERGILDMVAANNTNTIANIVFKKQEAYSTNQALLGLGIDYRWAANKIGTEFQVNNSIQTSSVFIYFFQKYYTATAEAPSSAGQFFAKGTDIELLRSKINENNPLCYVSSVTYGRMLIAKITSTATIDEITNELSASISNINGTLTTSNSKTLQEAKYEVYIIGGNAEDAIQAANNGIDGIANYMNNGANFNLASLGAPISYVVRHAADNSIVKMGNALEYTVNDDCIADPENTEKVHFKIDRFYIVDDCDNGIFDNTGRGEFTYSIKIFDEIRDNIHTEKKETISKYYGGEYWEIGAGPYEFYISNGSNNKMKIECILSEWDDTQETRITWPLIELPYSEMDSTKKSIIKVANNGNDCSAEFHFKVWKE